MKRLLKILLVLLLVLILAVGALLVFFDPNTLKPRIEAMAREEGVALTIEGDLGWQLWPSLGVEVNGVRLASPDAPDAPIARLERAGLSLAIRPLLGGEFEVHRVGIDGANIDLRVDANGRGNWEFLLPDEAAGVQEPAVDESEKSPLQLGVERLYLSDSSLSYVDERSGQDISLSDFNLELTGFNLLGDPMDLSLSWRGRFSDGETTLDLGGELQQPLELSADMSRLALPDGRLDLVLGEGSATSRLRADYQLELTGLDGELRYSGELALAEFSPRKTLIALGQTPPETASPDVLQRLSLDANFGGSASAMAVDTLTVQLDDTRLAGRFAITDFESAAMELSLTGDRLNADHYLPAPVDEDEVPEGPEATGDEELIPLELVRALNLQLSLELEQLVIAQMLLSQLQLQLAAADGVVELRRFDAVAYEGDIATTGQLDARGETAQLRLDGDLRELQLAPLMSDLELDEDIRFSGALNADLQGTSRGVTYNELLAALESQAQFNGVQVRAEPLNVEQRFCELATLVSSGESIERDWPPYTEMRRLSGQAKVADEVLTLESFSAGVEQLALNARGTINLASGAFDFTLPLTLEDESTSEDGCTLRSNYWVDRSLSLLRCRGELATLDPLSDCGPDSRGLRDLTADFAEHRLREQHGERIDEGEQRLEQEKERLRERLRERVGDEDTERLEDALRGLLRGE